MSKPNVLLTRRIPSAAFARLEAACDVGERVIFRRRSELDHANHVLIGRELKALLRADPAPGSEASNSKSQEYTFCGLPRVSETCGPCGVSCSETCERILRAAARVGAVGHAVGV